MNTLGGLLRVGAAIALAKTAHEKQVRKYTGAPYLHHCAEVAHMVAEVLPDSSQAIAAAWLHDTIEDTWVTGDDIERTCGAITAIFVERLTDTDDKTLKRAARKAKDRERLANSFHMVQTIKLADLISNTRSIAIHDCKFAKTYLAEKAKLLAVLDKADDRLWAKAYETLVEGVLTMEVMDAVENHGW